MKTITAEWLQNKNACEDGTEWVTKNKLIGLSPKEFAQKLYDGKKYDWMNWLFVKLFNKEQLIKYGAFALDQWIKYTEVNTRRTLTPSRYSKL